MILDMAYRDDMIDIIRQEPEKTFRDIGTNKKAVLSNTDVLDRMWPLYQKYLDEYEEDPWRAMTQALLETWPTRLTYDQPKQETLSPNEVWACGFRLNSKGKIALDLKPTLGLKCSSRWANLEDALKEDTTTAKYYFRPYKKDRTTLASKKYNLFALYTFKNKRACCMKYNELVQSDIAACRTVLNSLYAKVIPDFLIDRLYDPQPEKGEDS